MAEAADEDVQLRSLAVSTDTPLPPVVVEVQRAATPRPPPPRRPPKNITCDPDTLARIERGEHVLLPRLLDQWSALQRKNSWAWVQPAEHRLLKLRMGDVADVQFNPTRPGGGWRQVLAFEKKHPRHWEKSAVIVHVARSNWFCALAFPGLAAAPANDRDAEAETAAFKQVKGPFLILGPWGDHLQWGPFTVIVERPPYGPLWARREHGMDWFLSKCVSPARWRRAHPRRRGRRTASPLDVVKFLEDPRLVAWAVQLSSYRHPKLQPVPHGGYEKFMRFFSRRLVDEPHASVARLKDGSGRAAPQPDMPRRTHDRALMIGPGPPRKGAGNFLRTWLALNPFKTQLYTVLPSKWTAGCDGARLLRDPSHHAVRYTYLELKGEDKKRYGEPYGRNGCHLPYRSVVDDHFDRVERARLGPDAMRIGRTEAQFDATVRPALRAAVRAWREGYDAMMREDVRRESNYVKSASGGAKEMEQRLDKTLARPKVIATMQRRHEAVEGPAPAGSPPMGLDERKYYFKMGYIWDLVNSVFVPTPPGYGVVPGKVYEVLAAGAIPIVERSGYDCAFEHLPVLLVDRMDKLDLSTLPDRYREIACDASRQDYAAITLGYWQTWAKDTARAAAALGRGHRFEPDKGDPGPNGMYARPCARDPHMALHKDDPHGTVKGDMERRAKHFWPDKKDTHKINAGYISAQKEKEARKAQAAREATALKALEAKPAAKPKEEEETKKEKRSQSPEEARRERDRRAFAKAMQKREQVAKDQRERGRAKKKKETSPRRMEAAKQKPAAVPSSNVISDDALRAVLARLATADRMVLFTVVQFVRPDTAHSISGPMALARKGAGSMRADGRASPVFKYGARKDAFPALVHNWLASLARVGALRHTLVVGRDAHTCARLATMAQEIEGGGEAVTCLNSAESAAGWPPHAVREERHPGVLYAESAGGVTWEKYWWLHRVASLGFHAAYADVDSAFLGDPFAAFRDLARDRDCLNLSDRTREAAWSTRVDKQWRYEAWDVKQPPEPDPDAAGAPATTAIGGAEAERTYVPVAAGGGGGRCFTYPKAPYGLHAHGMRYELISTSIWFVNGSHASAGRDVLGHFVRLLEHKHANFSSWEGWPFDRLLAMRGGRIHKDGTFERVDRRAGGGVRGRVFEQTLWRWFLSQEPRHADALRFLSAKRPRDLPRTAPALLSPSTGGGHGGGGRRAPRGDCGWRYALLPQRRFANLRLLTEYCGRSGRAQRSRRTNATPPLDEMAGFFAHNAHARGADGRERGCADAMTPACERCAELLRAAAARAAAPGAQCCCGAPEQGFVFGDPADAASRAASRALLECAGVVWMHTGWSGEKAKHVELDTLGLFDRSLAARYNLKFPDTI